MKSTFIGYRESKYTQVMIQHEYILQTIMDELNSIVTWNTDLRKIELLEYSEETHTLIG